ncbi:tetraspanin-11 isoform X1 [Manis pentadactyla]|uniref:tetraspanin-11 isoform X1 n=1 Tax=Manis pentadactyla TaxID=143292 RepID=UPI00255CCB16|nr:tetraspanin-11 isoform X1 [Manis pentadactyla]
MAHYKAEQDDWLMVYLKYLLFVFNFFFWVGGTAVLAVGVWTLAEKSGYLSILASSTFAASAYILISAGALVMVTGFLGFGAVVREDRSCLSTYFCLLLVIFLVELVAGVLAHMYYQRLSDELKQHLAWTLAENYGQPGAAEITSSVDRLQQDFKCCGSNSSADWQHSAYILSREAEGRQVPDSCCKTVVTHCGQRTHPSNIYKVEGGCITKLERFLADHLLLMGAVGLGVACLQPRVNHVVTLFPRHYEGNAQGPGGQLELVRDLTGVCVGSAVRNNTSLGAIVDSSSPAPLPSLDRTVHLAWHPAHWLSTEKSASSRLTTGPSWQRGPSSQRPMPPPREGKPDL